MTSTLRPYQEMGVEWIRFLFENGFGGLLCDDMGLGKTHEVMSFMVGMREHEKIDSPFLVVCPTTVLSHWNNKMGEHAPGLKPVVYHGGQRNFEDAVGKSDLLLTSYGILRRDIDKLKNIPFALAVFDEIQYVKNPQTLAYLAAKEIRADMKLGLTGTPIENRLMELKALFDLTIPGYLGTDRDFETGFVKPIELDPASVKQEGLTRLISPFTLRRRKESVLQDLPEKIEDIRTCELSEDQVKLYRDALASRGRGLLQSLKNDKEVYLYLVYTQMNLGEDSQAEKTLKRGIETFPYEVRLYQTYARYLASKGKKDEALSLLEKALRMNPDDQALKIMKEGLEKPVVVSKEKTREEKGLPPRKTETEPEKKGPDFQELKSKGINAFKERKFKEANTFFTEALSVKDDREVYLYLAYTQMNLGENSKLGKTLEKGRKVFPEEVRLYRIYAKHLAATGEKKKALSLVEKGLKIAPDDTNLKSMKEYLMRP